MKNVNLLCWTINTPEKLQSCVNNKINNIIFEKIDLDQLEFSLDKLAKPVEEKE